MAAGPTRFSSEDSTRSPRGPTDSHEVTVHDDQILVPVPSDTSLAQMIASPFRNVAQLVKPVSLRRPSKTSTTSSIFLSLSPGSSSSSTCFPHSRRTPLTPPRSVLLRLSLLLFRQQRRRTTEFAQWLWRGTGMVPMRLSTTCRRVRCSTKEGTAMSVPHSTLWRWSQLDRIGRGRRVSGTSRLLNVEDP